MPNVINGTSTGSGGLITSGDDSGILNIQTNETTAITIDASQRVAFVAGTDALPAITTTGDTNTGIFFPAADTIAFAEGGTESMRIDSDGDVGIGTVSPAAKFEVSTGSSTKLRVTSTIDNNADIDFYTNSVHRGIIEFNSAGGLIYTIPSLPLTFGTNNTERARILSTGEFLVGKPNKSPGTVGISIEASGYQVLSMTGTTNATDTLNIYSTGASVYRFYVGMGGTIFATSTVISAISDIRYKENVRDLDVGLSEVMALKPRLYDWKEGKGADIKNARGFIAQEFETVFPDLIDTWKDPAPEGEEPYKSVRADLIPVLVKAIQEQQAIIETLTQRITALEGAE